MSVDYLLDQHKEFFNQMSQPSLTPLSSLLQADRKPELKKSDLTLWERFLYWRAFRKTRRNFIKSQRLIRKAEVASLAHNTFYKWKDYANMLPPKK